MEKVFIKDLLGDSAIDTSFMVNSFAVRQKRNGDDFISLVLKDKTGEIQAVMWDGVKDVVSTLETGSYVWVSGRVGTFNDRKQITVSRIKTIPAKDINEDDYVATSDSDPDQMWSELGNLINSIGHLHLRNLLLDFYQDPAYEEKVKRAPAAMGFHHTFLGGLLEHTLSMLKLAETVAGHYPILNRDLLLTGVFLHDLAKVEELEYVNEFKYSETGKLLGHIVMGTLETDKRMERLDFPKTLRNKVLHMIISHHGEEQFGSPKKPMLPEAIALHYIDMIDSRMEMAREAIEQSSGSEEKFTEWHRGLGVSLYKG